MKVGMLVPYASPQSGGVWTAVSNLASALTDSGMDVRLIGLRPRPDVASDVTQNLHLCRVVGPSAFGFAPRMFRQMLGESLDLVHVHGLWMYPSVAALRWSQSAGKPRVVSPHGMLDPWALQRSWWKKAVARKLFEDRALASATCIHALNEAELGSIRKLGLSCPIAIVPNGISLPDLDSAAPPTSSPTLLFLGRLDPKKGLIELLQAWRQLRVEAKRGGWCLQIVGWGSLAYTKAISDSASDLVAERLVEFAGPRFGRDKVDVLRTADAFVLPSYSEGQPMAVLEAWSYGLPAVTSPACNLPEGYAAGAAIAGGPDIPSLTAALATLLTLHAAERTAMGRAGRLLVEKAFAWPQVTAQLMEVYSWAVGESGKPDHVAIV